MSCFSEKQLIMYFKLTYFFCLLRCWLRKLEYSVSKSQVVEQQSLSVTQLLTEMTSIRITLYSTVVGVYCLVTGL